MSKAVLPGDAEPLPAAAAKLSRKKLQWLTAAYHEAGHCCAYWHYQWKFETVELFAAANGVNGILMPLTGARKDPFELATIYLAGPLAEAKFIGMDDWYGLARHVGADDLARATEALAHLPDPPSLYTVAAETNAILRLQWRNVERCAFELAGKRKLSYAEFQECLTRW